jgi:hypothetical protein
VVTNQIKKIKLGLSNGGRSGKVVVTIWWWSLS